MAGPQFNIFNKLKKVNMEEIIFDEDGIPLDKNIEIFRSNDLKPAHISGIEELTYYRCNGKRMYFGSGTDSEYAEFLEHLAKIAGFNSVSELISNNNICFFRELINFNMERGTIGPIISKKLYHDFRDNFNNANQYFNTFDSGRKFWVHYQNWCAGLYVAKEDGAIMVV